MKRIITILTFCLLLSCSTIAAAAGSISGSIVQPNSARGMQMTDRGMMWDMSAPKNKKSSDRADVWLIERGINFMALPYSTVQKWYSEGAIPANQPIYHTTTDEEGQFTFQDVPAADYYLMILNPYGHESSQNLSEKMSRDELMKKLPHVDEFELFMVGMRSCQVEKITLRNGQNLKLRPGFL